MPRRHITPIIPADEREYRIYQGNLALANMDPSTALGEAILNAYHGREPLGDGREKVIYPRIGHPGQAIAFYKQRGELRRLSADELKQSYYTRKLMHILLPDHMPDAHFVGTEPPIMHVDMVNAQPVTDGELKALYKDLRDRAGAFGIFLDPIPGNFLLGDDGKLKYVDDVELPADAGIIETEILKIEDPTVRNNALRYANRAYQQSHVLTERQGPTG